MDAQQWYELGSIIEVNDRKLFVYDSDNTNSQNKPVLLILHGYPTCSYDYFKALPYLITRFRVVIHDHLGFGYSDKPKDYSYLIIDQADFALSLWEKLGINKAHILAHDYGTSVATEIIAKESESSPITIEILSVTLCNGSVHIELAQLRLIQRLLLNKFTGPIVARMSNKKTLSKNLQNIFYDKSKIQQSEIDALWHMMTYNNGRKVLHKVTQYIKQRYQYWERWIGGLKNTELLIHIIWAKNDPVAVVKIAHTINQECKKSDLFLLNNLGHFPMLEDPLTWSDSIIESILKTKNNFK